MKEKQEVIDRRQAICKALNFYYDHNYIHNTFRTKTHADLKKRRRVKKKTLKKEPSFFETFSRGSKRASRARSGDSLRELLLIAGKLKTASNNIGGALNFLPNTSLNIIRRLLMRTAPEKELYLGMPISDLFADHLVCGVGPYQHRSAKGRYSVYTLRSPRPRRPSKTIKNPAFATRLKANLSL